MRQHAHNASWLPTFLVALAFTGSFLLAVGCTGQGTTSSIPAPTQEVIAAPTPISAPTPIAAPLPPYYHVSPSLDEQIYKSRAIVRVSLKSATSTTEKVSGEGGGTTYRPVHELRFTVHEYLKGTGPSEILVVVRDYLKYSTYSSKAEARKIADRTLAERVTSWDNRQAVIFLQDLEKPYSADGAAASAAANALTFTFSNFVMTRFNYSIDTLSRSWLPTSDAVSTSSAAQAAASGSLTFMTGGSEPWPAAITLAELKTEIADMEATLKAGEGIEGYDACIRAKLERERWMRGQRTVWEDWTPYQSSQALTSGLSAGAEIFKKWSSETESGPRYSNFWLSGPDSAYFQAPIVDDDSSSANGYYYTLSTVRPLPSGKYTVRHNEQFSWQIPCNFKPNDSYHVETITVTAPANTLHEAFFDPIYATSTGEYKADASLGTLKPAGYRKTGDTATTTIHSVAWKAQQATLTTSPGALPANHHVDFIELDGTVSLRLDVDTATTTTSGGKHTLSWRMCRQPWHAGDKLMLRIAQSGANLSGASSDAACTTPNPKPTPIATSTPIATTTPPVATTTPTPPPTPPQVAGLQVTSSGGGSISVGWQSRGGIDKYQLEYRFRGQDWRLVSNAITSTSHTESGLTCGPRDHFFRIRAYGDGATYAAQWGEWKNLAQVIPC